MHFITSTILATLAVTACAIPIPVSLHESAVSSDSGKELNRRLGDTVDIDTANTRGVYGGFRAGSLVQYVMIWSIRN